MAGSRTISWSDVHPRLHASYLSGLERLVAQPAFVRRLSQVMQAYPQMRWADVERVAADFMTTTEMLAVASTYLYGVALVRRGDHPDLSASLRALPLLPAGNPKRPGVTGIIDELRNYYGPLSPETRAALLAYVEDPSPETWSKVYMKIIKPGFGRRTTVWQYVTAVDPTFPKVGPRTGETWTRVPDAFTFLRALKLAAQERGDFPPDEPPDGDDGEPMPRRRTGTENPLRPDVRASLHPSDVQRLEQIERRWLHALARAETAYARGDTARAEEWDARADAYAEELESRIAAFEEDLEESGREADLTYVPADPNEYFAAVYAAHVVEPSPTAPAARMDPAYVPDHLRAYLEETYYGTGARFSEISDAQLLEAARDAYEARLALRTRQTAGARASNPRDAMLAW